MTHNGSVHNGQTPAETLTQIVAADGTSGGFVKDSQSGAAGLTLLALSSLSSVLSGYLYGLTLANNGSDATNDIDVAAGSCIDSTNAVPMALSALTKRLDAGWAAGTNQGMRNSAVAITDTTYHIYAVCKAAGADPDIYAHTSATVATVITALQAESGGSAYLYARRIGSIMRSTTIRAFTQAGDEFLWTASPIQNYLSDPGNDNAASLTVTTPGGIVTTAILQHAIQDVTPSAATYGLISSLATTDVAPSSVRHNAFVYGSATMAAIPNGSVAEIRVRTDTSSAVRRRVTGRTADHTQIVNTVGYIDTRGRLA